VAMVISLGGVVMIAKPSFLFGGKGINKLGLVLALMQVSIKLLLLLRMLSIKYIHYVLSSTAFFTKCMRRALSTRYIH